MEKLEIKGKLEDWVSSLKVNIKNLLNTESKIYRVTYL